MLILREYVKRSLIAQAFVGGRSYHHFCNNDVEAALRCAKQLARDYGVIAVVVDSAATPPCVLAVVMLNEAGDMEVAFDDHAL